jgi:hypothetical protein
LARVLNLPFSLDTRKLMQPRWGPTRRRRTPDVTPTTTTRRFAALAGTIALVLAACGGSSASPTAADGEPSAPATADTSPAAPAESAAASEAPAASTGSALDPAAAAAGISDLDSYQVDINIKADDDSTTLTILTTNTPVTSTHYTMAGADSMEIITIEGAGSWLFQSGTWVEPPGGADLYLSVFNFLAPDKIIAQYQLGNLAAAFHEVGSEDHNGTASKHLHLDAGDISGPAAANFPSDGMFDLWLAEDGGYLVGLAFSGTDEETNTLSEISIEVTRVNDPSISIEPPI